MWLFVRVHSFAFVLPVCYLTITQSHVRTIARNNTLDVQITPLTEKAVKKWSDLVQMYIKEPKPIAFKEVHENTSPTSIINGKQTRNGEQNIYFFQMY